MLNENDPRVHLTDLLAEHFDDAAAASRLAGALAAWRVAPDPGEVAAFAVRLKRVAEETSRAAWTARQDRDRSIAGLSALLTLVAIQVRVVEAEFWLASLGLAALGAISLMSLPDLPLAILLWLLAPLLALLGVRKIFRGANTRVIELELACPPSPIRLAMARLFIVLSYDAVLLVCVCVFLALAGRSGLTIQLVGHWTGPLLLVTGAELLAGLRLHWRYSSGLAYLVWVGFVAVWAGLPAAVVTPLVVGLEWVCFLVGLATIALALHAYGASLGGIVNRRRRA